MTLEVEVDHRQGDFRLQAAFRAEGRLTALFGRSGSGKTTLVNAVAGLVRPQAARIAVDGTVLVDTARGLFVPRHRRRIGYVFQEGRLFPHLTVRQNLLFGRWLSGRRGSDDAREFEQVVAMLGVAPLLGRRPGGLSGGEKQRVAIGRALLSRPRLLLMDEPLASLDEERKAEILPYIERLRDEAGVPVVYVSHALPEVTRLADTVVLIEAGRVQAAGPAGEVLGGSLPSRVLAHGPEAGALLEGRVEARDERFALTLLATPAGPLWIPGLEHPVGGRLRAFVRARDVMVSLGALEGVSALNRLPGRIEAVAPGEGPWREVRIACGEARLVTRVTARSVEELALAPGREVIVVVKSVQLAGP